MDDFFKFVVILAGIVALFVKTIGKASKKLSEVATSGKAQSAAERELERALAKYAKGLRADPGQADAAADTQPANRQAEGEIFQAGTEVVPLAPLARAASIPAAVAAAPHRAARKPGRKPAAKPGPPRAAAVSKTSAVRGPIRLNPRTMARVAILSEIWRPPLALRKEQPWERE